MASGGKKASAGRDAGARRADLEAFAARIMAARLIEVGDAVEEDEITQAMGVLSLAMSKTRGGRGVARGFSWITGRFELRRDQFGAGVMSTYASSGIRVSMEAHLLEENRIIQAKIRVIGCGWELHDTPSGGAARVQVRPREDGQGAYIWRESHYSYGRRWDPTPDKAAENFYYEDGGIKCRQRFFQGAAGARGDAPVFEGFFKDGSRRVIEYGDSIRGKHRSKNLGPAYQEFHPGGEVSLVIFAEHGKQLGETKRFLPGGGEAGKPSENGGIPCASITQVDSWSLKSDAEQVKPFGQAIGEALRTHSAMGKGKVRQGGVGGRWRQMTN